jgi:hypothetical protein
MSWWLLALIVAVAMLLGAFSLGLGIWLYFAWPHLRPARRRQPTKGR